jgi:annexin A7/11
MKGMGTDEDTIISILTSRSNKQRQEMSKAFSTEYERDLLDDLKSELGGKFEDVIVALLMLPDQYLCKQLRKAMDGIGTEEETLIEILCPMSNEQVQALIPCYEESNLF